MSRLFVVILAILLLSGCADNVSLEQASNMREVGFISGLWHGMIMLWAFIWSVFDSSTTIYAIYNNGGFYNFGFILGTFLSVEVCKIIVQWLIAFVLAIVALIVSVFS